MSADDLRQILALLADYGRSVDTDGWDELAALWAEDGVLRVFGKEHTGPGAIVAFMKGAVRGMHLTGVPHVVFDGDRAEARSDYVFFEQEGRRLFSAGSYEDAFVRTADGWRFARRRIAMRMAAGGREETR